MQILRVAIIFDLGTCGPRGAEAAQPIKLWSFRTGDAVRSSPTLSSDGKAVYVGSRDNNLYAINTVDGSKNWSFPTGGSVVSTPALSSDGKVVYVGSENNEVYAIVDHC